MAGQASGNMDMYQNMHPIRVKRLGCISAFTARFANDAQSGRRCAGLQQKRTHVRLHE